MATFLVLVVAGGGIVGPRLGHAVVLGIAFIAQTEGADVFNGHGFNPRSIFCGAGSVYCRDGITSNSIRDTLAINAIRALHLDFGAVDIIYNERENQFYVLEVNTAPGLEGTTLQKYTESINAL